MSSRGAGNGFTDIDRGDSLSAGWVKGEAAKRAAKPTLDAAEHSER